MKELDFFLISLPSSPKMKTTYFKAAFSKIELHYLASGERKYGLTHL